MSRLAIFLLTACLGASAMAYLAVPLLDRKHDRVGLLVLWFGVWLWRRSRRKMRQPLSLNIASHLMKKHD